MASVSDLLAGKSAIITGASRGIGRAIAELFAVHGAALVLCGRSEDVAVPLAAKGAKTVIVQGDVADAEVQKELVRKAREAYGRLDILVNNAGVLTPGILGMTDMGKVRAMFELNVHAAINLSQMAARVMAAGKSGSIINLTSIAGIRGADGMAAYSASKAAILGFTLAAAKELAPKGIRVNAIAPGFIDTAMTRGLPPAVFEKTVAGIGLGRAGEAVDVAKAALFFAGDLSGYITGQVLGVDGGMTM
jgi:3-oxoacyl-[acyl-carrier protein] reductase